MENDRCVEHAIRKSCLSVICLTDRQLFCLLLFLLSFFVSAFAYISAKFGLTEDYGKIIIGNIMLLVPGVAFVNALRDMIGGDMMSGILRVCESILLAVFLAAGSFMALMFLGGVL